MVQEMYKHQFNNVFKFQSQIFAHTARSLCIWRPKKSDGTRQRKNVAQCWRETVMADAMKSNVIGER